MKNLKVLVDKWIEQEAGGFSYRAADYTDHIEVLVFLSPLPGTIATFAMHATLIPEPCVYVVLPPLMAYHVDDNWFNDWNQHKQSAIDVANRLEVYLAATAPDADAGDGENGGE